MSSKIFHLIYLFVLINCVLSDELVSVVVVFRHGDRTPIQPYPTDPYRNSSFWPVGFGQLTNRGKQQHFALGKWLRTRYNNFLPDSYSEKDIYIRSSDSDRTLMSAESNLAGLYPPKTKQIWNKDIPWQPIPIHTVPELEDPVVAAKKSCPKYDKLLRELFKTPFFANISHQNHDLYAYLTRYSGTTIKNLETLEYLFNTFSIETWYNYTLPDWATKVFPAKMQHWAEMSFTTSCYTQDLARLKVGLLFNEIIEHLRNSSQSNGLSRKFRVFSGHDTNIANLLNAMGAFKPHCPPYASTIIFELKRNASFEYVNVYYRRSDVLENIQVKNCDFNCPFEDFINILAPITLNLQEWHAECQLEWVNFGNVRFLVLATIATGSALVLLIVLLMLKMKFKRNGNLDGDYMKLPNDEVA